MKPPKIIHQTWKTKEIPEKFRWDFDSWHDFHPDWQFYFWDDADLDDFVRMEHPHLLELYLGYTHRINQVMMARYLILKKFGGYFVDIDLECLKPIEPILEKFSLMVGYEPPIHAEHPAAVRRKLSQIISTSFIASPPEHPLFDYIISRLPDFRHCHDPLEATGSIFLTTMIEEAPWENKSDLGIAWYGSLNAFDRAMTWGGETFDIDTWEVWTRQAFAVHHWAGTWFRKDSIEKPEYIRIMGRVLTDQSTVGPPNLTPNGEEHPKISCIMPTRNRFLFAKNAIDCFQRQTYPNTELVIVEHAPNDNLLMAYVESLGDERIRLFREPDGNQTLGEVRNFALDQCTGHYIAVWDDDDLCDPYRLEAQHALLGMMKAHACVMSRMVDWAPAVEHLLINEEREWENTLLCEAAHMPRYGHLNVGEDGVMQKALMKYARIAWLDMPRLYFYVIHGTNVWASDHFDDHWTVAMRRYTGTTYQRVLRELSKRLPIARYPQETASGIDASTSTPMDLVAAILSKPISPLV